MWDDLPEQYFPLGDGAIAVLKAYVDASTRDAGLLTVAGYLIDSVRVRRFRQRWAEAFGDATFSWADLISRSGPFKGLKGREHDADHTALVTAGISMIREHVIAGTVVSMWKQDVEQFGPTFIKGFGHAYSIAGHMAMAGLSQAATRIGVRGGIAYVIEAGDDGYDQLEHLLSYAPQSHDVRALYQWAGHSVTPKVPHSPFHAPDTLAWEWGKFMLETGIEHKRPMRLSFAHLVRDRLSSYTFQHLHGASLLRFFNRIRDLGVQQMQEDAAATQAVESIDVSAAVNPARDEDLE